jgi:ssDNA-binding Zn-finger/Zn-ribbon topoisomerase 1
VTGWKKYIALLFILVLTFFISYSSIYLPLNSKLIGELAKATNMGEAPAGMLCPKCKSSMIIKLARNGKFYSCSKYPDCDGARTIEGNVLEGPKETGEMCPLCGDKKGKSGGGKVEGGL